MKSLHRRVQFLSNIATIIIAVLLLVIVVKQFVSPAPPAETSLSSVKTALTSTAQISEPNAAQKTTPLGKTVPLSGIDWQKNKKTLILYLSTRCRFCDESMPFYQRLAEKYSESKDVKLMAVFPQSADEAKAHFKNQRVGINDVLNAQLTSIGVTATPTLLLVNETGVVTDMWRGKLPIEKESDVLNKL
jgi:thiol-disulfide isomerase/thioredoxin